MKRDHNVVTNKIAVYAILLLLHSKPFRSTAALQDFRWLEGKTLWRINQ
jgi:hypothetical protein